MAATPNLLQASPAGNGAEPGKRLTPKQAQFVCEYLVDLNAAKAAIRAGYSPRSAYNLGYYLLNIPAVAAAIEVAMAERSARVRINADMVVQRWWRIATAVRSFPRSRLTPQPLRCAITATSSTRSLRPNARTTRICSSAW